MPLREESRENYLQEGVGETRFSKRLGILAPPATKAENIENIRDLTDSITTGFNKSDMNISFKEFLNSFKEYINKGLSFFKRGGDGIEDTVDRLDGLDDIFDDIDIKSSRRKGKKDYSSYDDSDEDDDQDYSGKAKNKSQKQRLEAFDLENKFSVKNLGRFMKLIKDKDVSAVNILKQQVKASFLSTASERLKSTEIPFLEKIGKNFDERAEENNKNVQEALAEKVETPKKTYDELEKEARTTRFKEVETKLTTERATDIKILDKDIDALKDKLENTLTSLKQALESDDKEKIKSLELTVENIRVEKKNLLDSKKYVEEFYVELLKEEKKSINKKTLVEILKETKAVKPVETSAQEAEAEAEQQRSTDRLAKSAKETAEQQTKEIGEGQEQIVETIQEAAYAVIKTNKDKERGDNVFDKDSIDVNKKSGKKPGRIRSAANRLKTTLKTPTSQLGFGTKATGVVAAGAAGFAIGTGIQKLASDYFGREDWLLAPLTDKRDREQAKKSEEFKETMRKKAETDVKKMSSDDAFELGKDDQGIWRIEKHNKLRAGQSIMLKDGKFVTAKEYNDSLKEDKTEVDNQEQQSQEAVATQVEKPDSNVTTTETKTELGKPVVTIPISNEAADKQMLPAKQAGIDVSKDGTYIVKVGEGSQQVIPQDFFPAKPGTSERSTERIGNSEPITQTIAPDSSKKRMNGGKTITIQAAMKHPETGEMLYGIATVPIRFGDNNGERLAKRSAEMKADADLAKKHGITKLSGVTHKVIKGKPKDVVEAVPTSLEGQTVQTVTPEAIEPVISSGRELAKDVKERERGEKLTTEKTIKTGGEPFQIKMPPAQPPVVINNSPKSDAHTLRRVTRIDDPGTIILNSNLM